MRWKDGDIPGYEGLYQVSDHGRVKSLAKLKKIRGGGLQPMPERIKTLTWGANRDPKHKRLTRYVLSLLSLSLERLTTNRLVLEAFVGPCPDGMECCHNDGDPSDNRLENLRWDTHLNNQRDMLQHKTNNAGSRHGMSKLTEADVAEIKMQFAAGRRRKEIAAEFGIRHDYVAAVANGRRWKHA